MACPYFMPLAKLENGAWPHPARLPLGGGWTGHCTAPGHEGQIPSQDILQAFCNLGYAGSCNWSPPQRSWDSVRFAIASPNGFTRDKNVPNTLPCRILRLLYVCERDHRPVAHGELKFDLNAETWLCRHEDPRIQKMAECFLESYLERRLEAGNPGEHHRKKEAE